MKTKKKIIITLVIMATFTLVSFNFAEIKIQRASTYCVNPVLGSCYAYDNEPFKYDIADDWAQIYRTIYLTIIGLAGLLIFAFLNFAYPGKTQKSERIEAIIKKYYMIGCCLFLLADSIYLNYLIFTASYCSEIGLQHGEHVLVRILFFLIFIVLLFASGVAISRIRDIGNR